MDEYEYTSDGEWPEPEPESEPESKTFEDYYYPPKTHYTGLSDQWSYYYPARRGSSSSQSMNSNSNSNLEYEVEAEESNSEYEDEGEDEDEVEDFYSNPYSGPHAKSRESRRNGDGDDDDDDAPAQARAMRVVYIPDKTESLVEEEQKENVQETGKGEGPSKPEPRKYWDWHRDWYMVYGIAAAAAVFLTLSLFPFHDTAAKVMGFWSSSSSSSSSSSDNDSCTSTSTSVQEQQPFDLPMDLEYTRRLGHFWADYRMLVAPNRDFGTWFDDSSTGPNTLTSTEAHATNQNKNENENGDKNALIDRRNAELELARGEWDKFLDARMRIVLDLVDDGDGDGNGGGGGEREKNKNTDKNKIRPPWRVYVDEIIAAAPVPVPDNGGPGRTDQENGTSDGSGGGKKRNRKEVTVQNIAQKLLHKAAAGTTSTTRATRVSIPQNQDQNQNRNFDKDNLQDLHDQEGAYGEAQGYKSKGNYEEVEEQEEEEEKHYYYHVDNATSLAFHTAARQVTQSLAETHIQLFAHVPAALEHVTAALEAEKEFQFLSKTMTSALRKKNTRYSKLNNKNNNNNNKKQDCNAQCCLPKLQRRLVLLLGVRDRMHESLQWLQEQFPARVTGNRTVFDEKQQKQQKKEKGEENKEKEMIKIKTSEELLRVWAALLMDLQEGLLIMLRTEDVARKSNLNLNAKGKGNNTPLSPLTAGTHSDTHDNGNSNNDDNSDNKGVRAVDSDNDISWEAWKKRNCGGTSCYASDPPPHHHHHPTISGYFVGLKEILTGTKKTETKTNTIITETAQIAVDEANWSREKYGDRKQRIWRGVYEKACCSEDGILALLLKNAAGMSVVDEQDLI